MLAFLYERSRAFGGSPQSGMLNLATEPVTDNGRMLEAIVFELAHLNGLEDGFIEWLETVNQFCNTAITGLTAEQPDKETRDRLTEPLGFTDQLLIRTDKNRSWVIEGDEKLKNVLTFALADKGIVFRNETTRQQPVKVPAP